MNQKVPQFFGMTVITIFYCLLPLTTQAQLPFDSLVLYMPFEDIQETEVIDKSRYRNDGVIVNASVAYDIISAYHTHHVFRSRPTS